MFDITSKHLTLPAFERTKAVRACLVGSAILSFLILYSFPPVMVALGACGLVSVAVVLRWPIAGFCLLAISVPWGSVAGTTAASLPFSTTDLVVSLLFGVWLASAAHAHANPFRKVAWTPYVVLLILVMTVSMSVAVSVHASEREVVKWLELLVVFLSGTWFITSRLQVQWIVGCLIAAGVSQAILGYYQFAFQAGPAAFTHGQFFRAFGTFDQPNPYAGYLNMIFPVAFARFLAPSFRHDRRIYGTASAVLLVGLLASQSRGALLATVVATAALLAISASWIRFPGLIAVLSALLASLGTSLGIVPSGPLVRILNAVGLGGVAFGHVTDANFSAIERAAHWLAGMRMFAAHPLLGVGIGNFGDAYPAYHPRGWYAALSHAHNYYINIAAECGILGLGAYILFVGSALWYSYAVFATARDGITRATTLGVLGALIATDFHNLFDVLYVHGMVALLGVLMALVVASGRMPATVPA